MAALFAALASADEFQRPAAGRAQADVPALAPAGICCEQEIVTGPSAALNVQSTLQITARSEALSVLTTTESFAGVIAQE